jgi:hypothetical protein
MFPVISLPVMKTDPHTYTSISNTSKPILTTNGKIKKTQVENKVDVDQWTKEETMILINGYRKHQPTKSDSLKAIDFWEIIATNLSGKLTVFFFY